MNDSQLIKFLLDNATGLSVSTLSLYLMFRLFDKHLARLTIHLESLQRLVVILHTRGERYQREVEKTLGRIEQRINQPPANQPINQPINQRWERQDEPLFQSWLQAWSPAPQKNPSPILRPDGADQTPFNRQPPNHVEQNNKPSDPLAELAKNL